ncbi:MAG: anaerobic ribonucleoside-triphosphate reductase activating protein [Lachnospiraceae bacterium]|nr:anaerobic ribonucleoside-triphosphate reductase activating protein [Lachnospiraceae bacterium]
MLICGYNKTTLLDYPGRTACTVFTGNCNFRCVYCHNAPLVLDPSSQPAVPEEEIFSFLRKRKNILNGVCITGGEPTLQPDLSGFIEKIRELGYDVKLDTNGYRPGVLRELTDKGLVNMVAMDIKTDRKRYPLITQVEKTDLKKLDESIDILIKGDTDYEFRTTVVDEYFDDEAAEDTGRWLKGAKVLYLQEFKDGDTVIKGGLHSPGRAKMERYAGILSEYIDKVELRGVD